MQAQALIRSLLTTENNPTMSTLDEDFDKEENEHLILTVQKTIGCFECEKGCAILVNGRYETPPDFPKNQCSKCSIARYCNRECQKKHWKSGHKEECAMYCQNRNANFCLPECLRGSNWINDDLFDAAMRNRKGAFLENMSKVNKTVSLALTVAVIGTMYGKVRFVIAARFMGSSTLPVDVNHLVYETIDEGEEALAMIKAGSGKVSEEAMELLYQHLEKFCVECQENNGRVTSMTLGRGLSTKCEEFQERLAPISKSIIMMPSMDYVASDVMSETMAAFHEFGFGR